MTDQDNPKAVENIEEEEEIEENENINQVQEEYEEEMDNQVNEEDGPEFQVAFDIQMTEGSFILLVGKTDQKKLIMRLVDKEDENKPFYQNEFSLEELKELNSYFNNFDNEKDAIDCIIKNLNESEKEIEIIDENNIKLSIFLGEVSNSKIDFLLIKHQYVIESDDQEQELEHEQEQEKEEQMHDDKENNINNNKQNIVREEIKPDVNEEFVEEVENEDNDNYDDNAEHTDDNLEYSEENNEKTEKRDNNENSNNDNAILNITPFKNVSKNIRNENVLHTIIEEVNENNVITPKSTLTIERQNETKIINDSNKQNEIKNENNNILEKEKENENENENQVHDHRISKVIEELKENLDSLGGAMNYIDQDDEELEQEQNTNENEVNKGRNEDFNLLKNEVLKTINTLSNNFNNQLKKQNDYFEKMEKKIRDENDKKIKEIRNELNKKNTQLNDIKNSFNNILDEKISVLEQKINEIINELDNDANKDNNSIKKLQEKNKQNNKITNLKNTNIEKIKNDLSIRINQIEQKINNINNLTNNGVNNDNIKEFIDKINIIENKIKQNDSNSQNNDNGNIINNLENKIKNIEIKLKNIESKKNDKEKKNLYNKITILENQSKILENKINNITKIREDAAPAGQNEEIFEKINSLEELINNIKVKKKKSDIHIKKSIEEINNNDLINKVNNLMKWSKAYKAELQNMENELRNNDNFLNNIETRIKILENKNISRQPIDTNKNEIKEKVITNVIMAPNDESKRVNVKKVKKPKNHSTKNKDIENRENREKINNVTKNYRVLRNIGENTDNNNNNNKYLSLTYNTGGITNSHSVNRYELKKDNYLDKTNIEYQVVTRPRSKSKEHKRNMPQQDIFYDNQTSQSIKYGDSNPPIPKEYENSITESRIVEYDDITFIENKIKEIYQKSNIDFNLVYRATDDGDKARDFHRKCDKIGPNVTFVKTKKDFVFGGFTVKNWEHLKRDINEKKPNLGSASRDARAFGFCVNNQRIYKNERPDEYAIWCNRNFGATFKNNFFQIFDNCFKKGGYCSKKDNSHFGGQKFDYEINGGESKFAIDDIEVYEILFQ